MSLSRRSLNICLHNHVSLVHLGWNHMVQTFPLPTFTENGEWTANPTAHASMREWPTCSTTSPRLSLAPPTDPLVFTQYATNYCKVEKMQSMKLTGKSKTHFHFFYLIQDSRALVDKCKHTMYDCKAKKLCSTAMGNLSKACNTITTSTTTSTMHHLQAYLANISPVIEAQFVCVLTLLHIKMPAIFIVTRTFPLHIVPHPCGHTSRKSTTNTNCLFSEASRCLTNSASSSHTLFSIPKMPSISSRTELVTLQPINS